MAKKMIKIPGHATKLLLRLMSAVFTFTFTLFIYATGQVVQPAQGAGAGKVLTGMGIFSRDSVTPLPEYGVSPLYGIPMYGPIVLYGMPYADFSVKGTIRADLEKNVIPGIKVTLQDTASKQIVDSAITDGSGSYVMNFTAMPSLHTWILTAQDIDGAANGSFSKKDTLISIPPGNLVGGSGFYSGAGLAIVDLYLKSIPSAVSPGGRTGSSPQPFVSVRQIASGTLEAQYRLEAPARTWMAIYGADGRLVREVFDRNESAGSHSAVVETGGLAQGVYFLKLHAGSYISVSRVTVGK
jgi:putative lipoprotein (rSAM/lipoprotein system)